MHISVITLGRLLWLLLFETKKTKNDDRIGSSIPVRLLGLNPGSAS